MVEKRVDVFVIIAVILAIAGFVIIASNDFSLTGAFGIFAEGDEDTVVWDLNFSSDDNDDEAHATVYDSKGDLYVVGYGVNLSNGSSNKDWWIKKFFSNGTEDATNWNKSFDPYNVSLDIAYGVDVDSNDNVFVVGTVEDSDETPYGWIKGYNSSGAENSTWNINFTKSVGIGFRDISIDSNDNVYVVGFGHTIASATSNFDWHIKKFFSNGTEDLTNWNKTYSKSDNNMELAKGVTFDSNNNIFVVGVGQNLVSSSSGDDLWVKKFNSSGSENTTHWNKSFSNGDDSSSQLDSTVERLEDVAVDSNDNIYVVGRGSNLTAADSEQDGWIKKFFANGTEDVTNWNISFSNSTSVADTSIAHDIAVDSRDNIYVVGYVGSADKNWVIKKYNPSGFEDITNWNKSIHFSTDDQAFGIAINSVNNLSVVGYSSGLFGPISQRDGWIKHFEGDLVECEYLNDNSIMTHNLSSTGTCFSINNSDLTLDCAGYTINYSQAGTLGYGVNNTGYKNITVKNCVIEEGNESTDSKHGVFYETGNNGTIFNNTITMFSNVSSAILINSKSRLQNVSNNNITTYGNESFGIQLFIVNSSTIESNVVTTSGGDIDESQDDGAAILLEGSHNNFISNEVFLSDSLSYGFLLQTDSSINNSYSFNNATGGGFGFYVNSAGSQNLFSNNTALNNDGLTLILSHGNDFFNFSITNANDISITIALSNDNNFTSFILNTSPSNGVAITSGSHRNIFDQFTVFGAGDSFVFADAANENNTIKNSTIRNSTTAFYLDSFAHVGNLFLNNNVTNLTGGETFLDLGTGINTVIYNNTYGQINWTLSNLTSNISLQVGDTIFLEQNKIGLTDGNRSINLNGSAQIEVRNVSYTQTPKLLKNNARCDNTDSCNLTYDSSTNITFVNISSFSNFTTQESVVPVTSSSGSSLITSSSAQLKITTDESATCKYALVDTNYDAMTKGPMSVVSGTTHTHSVVGLSSSTTYNYYVRCKDDAGNVQTTSTSISFTTASESSVASGGGGSGGGTGSNIAGDFSKKIWSSLNKGETAKVEVQNGAIGITEVSFPVTETIHGVWVKVKKTETLPSNIPSIRQKIYKNIEIITSFSLKEEHIKQAEINFKVTKSWLSENKITRDDITLYRFNDDHWVQLLTTTGKDDGAYIHYTAKTAGFSYFIIGEKINKKYQIENFSNVSLTDGQERVIEVSIENEGSNEGEEVEKKSLAGQASFFSFSGSLEHHTKVWISAFFITGIIIGIITIFFVFKRKKFPKRKKK